MTYSLSALTEHLRRVVALNFQSPIWLTAEIAQVSQAREHYFLALVEKGDTDLLAQADAVLWAGEARRLRRALGPVLPSVLCEGLQVRLQVRVEFHERYGLQLLIMDVDPDYTLGELQRQRRETVARLEAEGLFGLQKALPLPLVLQRIAVITSEGAAGKQDFQEHLAGNAFGYAFDCELFTASVQGVSMAEEMVAALGAVGARAQEFDCAVIVRGGGARLDLAAFDGLEVCRAAAQLPLPLLTGIGHDIDESVLDLVAHTILKTPTAVADFLLQHNLFFEQAVRQLASQAHTASQAMLKNRFLDIEKLEQASHYLSAARLRRASLELDALENALPQLSRQVLRAAARQLDQTEVLTQALHPSAVLQRGYSLTLKKDGKAVASPSDVVPGDVLETHVRQGIIRSTVVK